MLVYEAGCEKATTKLEHNTMESKRRKRIQVTCTLLVASAILLGTDGGWYCYFFLQNTCVLNNI